MENKGLFIVFEGIDGSGTSTHVHALERKIEDMDKYQDILRTHEPWKNEEIRTRLEKDKDSYSGAEDLAELYVQDRANHFSDLIKPNLDAGVIVLSSRYKMSTCAFQGAQGVDMNKLLKMHDEKCIPNPDLTFFLDVPEEIAQHRLGMRTRLEKFEHDREFVNKIIDSYHGLVNRAISDSTLFGRVIKIDGNRPQWKVSKDIFNQFLRVYSSS